jgi:hypothetical protein
MTIQRPNDNSLGKALPCFHLAGIQRICSRHQCPYRRCERDSGGAAGDSASINFAGAAIASRFPSPCRWQYAVNVEGVEELLRTRVTMRMGA